MADRSQVSYTKKEETDEAIADTGKNLAQRFNARRGK